MSGDEFAGTSAVIRFPPISSVLFGRASPETTPEATGAKFSLRPRLVHRTESSFLELPAERRSEPPCVSMRFCWPHRRIRMLTHGGSVTLNLKVLLNELSVRCTSCTNRSSLEVSKREVDVLRIVPLVPVQRGAASASGPAGLRNKTVLTSAILDRPTRPSRNVDTDGRH